MYTETQFKPSLCENIPGMSEGLKINRIVFQVPDTHHSLANSNTCQYYGKHPIFRQYQDQY